MTREDSLNSAVPYFLMTPVPSTQTVMHKNNLTTINALQMRLTDY